MAATQKQVNISTLRLRDTRTVEVPVRGHTLTVTYRIEDDSGVDQELGRARMDAQRADDLARAVFTLPQGSPEYEEAASELERATSDMSALRAMVAFDPRRIVCRRISARFVAWNLGDADGPFPLEFDPLYDGPVSTSILHEIYAAVQALPIASVPNLPLLVSTRTIEA